MKILDKLTNDVLFELVTSINRIINVLDISRPTRLAGYKNGFNLKDVL